MPLLEKLQSSLADSNLLEEMQNHQRVVICQDEPTNPYACFAQDWCYTYHSLISLTECMSLIFLGLIIVSMLFPLRFQLLAALAILPTTVSANPLPSTDAPPSSCYDSFACIGIIIIMPILGIMLIVLFIYCISRDNGDNRRGECMCTLLFLLCCCESAGAEDLVDVCFVLPSAECTLMWYLTILTACSFSLSIFLVCYFLHLSIAWIVKKIKK